ncbi:HYR domain-containing protein [Winogradskyella sp. 3972H.M.0a.05]|uniref:HYR domain-containing protein n=1 Tax=Winogradskyella sp. 3972H.M.0a.05 TaxID=2950277 RepID=UPI003393A8AF
MKRLLLLSIIMAFGIASYAQTTWTGAGADTNWSNTDNWDTNLVPTASDDVIIPTGFTVTLNVSGNVRSITLQGNSTLDMNTSFEFSEPSTFETGTTVNWNTGTLNGNTSTLTNSGTMNLMSVGTKIISGDTVLDNSGTINITSSGDLSIPQGILNNQASGVIDLQEDGGNITWSGGTVHILNNSGLIKKTTSAGEAQIVLLLNNNDGTIEVESGTLSLQNTIGKNLTDGTYNISSGATMDWDTRITVSGTLTGVNNGTLNWTSIVDVPVSATFNFTGSGDFNWTGGSLNGGGTLTNLGTINLPGTGSKSIFEDSNFDNEGTVNITGAGNLSISQGIFNNEASGVLDLQADSGDITWSGGSVHILNNAGLIRKTTSLGEAQIVALLNNNDGTISVESGILSFQNTIGKNLTDGTYNISSGATMDWDTTMTLSGDISGTNEGTLNWGSIVDVPGSATMDITGSGVINWNGGSLNGGGTLTNQSTINLPGTGAKSIFGDTAFSNEATFNITGAGDLLISQGTFDNQASGVLDLQEDSGNISWSGGSVHILNNTGLIRKTTSTGEAQIHVLLNNNGGTISVENGTLSFQNSIGKNLTGGVYNVSPGAAFDWDGLVTLLGTLTGTVDGDLNATNTIAVDLDTTATINIAGTGNANWVSGILNGGGTLINQSIINLTGTGSKSILGDTTLNNEGLINFTASGDLFISQGILNNQASGVIDLMTDASNLTWSGGTSHILNNFGLIRRSTSSGIVVSFVELTNFGTIEVASGELEISSSEPFINETTGRVKGVGIFDLPSTSSYTNNGIFEPGLSPGTLTVQGDYESTATSVLDVELNGLTPDTEHDVLAVIGNNNVFDGSVAITMGFEADEGDTFTIATTTGTIVTQNLTTPIIVDYDGKRYTFDVTYPNDNEVLLTISDKLDILPPDIITQNITVQLDASGNASITASQVDNGTTDNCTPTNELQFDLDITDFTCADLGDNTVTLTVTDNDGNSANAPATVTVEDNIDPTVVTQNITVQLDASGNASITTGDIDDGSSDNCTVANLSLDVTDFTCANLGANTVNLIVTDQSGNSASASATVTVEDTVDPTVVTQNITVQLDASGNASITTGDIDNGSSDNCTVSNLSLDVTDFTCADLGANTVNLTVTDQSGNSASASATVTVEDTVNPIVVTQNITVQLDASGNASITTGDIDNGSSDNCTVSNLSLDVTDFTCADLGANTVNLTATDQSGNSASVSAIVTVEDTVDPVINCPAGFTVETVGDFILPDYFVEGDVTASDNCGFTVVQTPVAGTNLPDGDHIIEYEVTDDAGNTATCSFELKVEDMTLSIENNQLVDNDISLYPNPVEDSFTLKNLGNIELTSITIVDVKGSIIQQLDLRTMTIEKIINISNYQSGVYFARIESRNGFIVKRIIKQ